MARVIGFVFDGLANKFIRLVLEVLGEDRQHPMVDQ
jgi:hypothetical protein